MKTESNKFLWGAATSAYQIEGAVAEDGRGPSIWDVYERIPGKIANGDVATTACDHYHRWAADVELMRSLNLQAYRFSIGWPRIQPTGRGPANPAGLDFYDRLVDGLHQADIEPLVTLYHWDLPAALQFELGGWLHPDLPKLFADYAGLVFDRLGDRVRLWMTINEPWCVVDGGYLWGGHPPGSKNPVWAYQVAHNLIRAHAYAAARLRASKHSAANVSFALNMAYRYAASDRPEDRAAAERSMLDFGGWFADPVFLGDYPAALRQRLGALLPEFAAQDIDLLKNSADYLALNYYHSEIVKHAPGRGEMEYEVVPQPDRLHTAMDWPVVPDGLRDLLIWLDDRYGHPPIYITENGAAFDEQPGPDGVVDDRPRIDYLRDHFRAVRQAADRGVDVRGHCVWSLMDNFEWACGYGKRFGLVHCDFETQQRTVKSSGRWYARLIETGCLDEESPDSAPAGVSP